MKGENRGVRRIRKEVNGKFGMGCLKRLQGLRLQLGKGGILRRSGEGKMDSIDRKRALQSTGGPPNGGVEDKCSLGEIGGIGEGFQQKESRQRMPNEEVWPSRDGTSSTPISNKRSQFDSTVPGSFESGGKIGLGGGRLSEPSGTFAGRAVEGRQGNRSVRDCGKYW